MICIPIQELPFALVNGKRESDAVIQELLHSDREVKKRQVMPRKEFTTGDNLEDPDADIALLALLMRRHLVFLDNALRKHWVCVCQKCSGPSMRLSMPQQTKGFVTKPSPLVLILDNRRCRRDEYLD